MSKWEIELQRTFFSLDFFEKQQKKKNTGKDKGKWIVFYLLSFLFILSVNNLINISSLCHYYLMFNLHKKKKRPYNIDFKNLKEI